MKVVLDTNVLISGIYFGGPPGKIVEAWGSRRFQLDDDKFFACALAGKATTIVSGDSELLNVSGYCGIQVLTPKAFVSQRLDQSD